MTSPIIQMCYFINPQPPPYFQSLGDNQGNWLVFVICCLCSFFHYLDYYLLCWLNNVTGNCNTPNYTMSQIVILFATMPCGWYNSIHVICLGFKFHVEWCNLLFLHMPMRVAKVLKIMLGSYHIYCSACWWDSGLWGWLWCDSIFYEGPCDSLRQRMPKNWMAIKCNLRVIYYDADINHSMMMHIHI